MLAKQMRNIDIFHANIMYLPLWGNIALRYNTSTILVTWLHSCEFHTTWLYKFLLFLLIVLASCEAQRTIPLAGVCWNTEQRWSL